MHLPHRVLRPISLLAVAAFLAAASTVGTPAPVQAASFGSRTLYRGTSGSDVLELQIRVAGWYTNCAGVSCHEHFPLDGSFGAKTERAVKNFQKAYGLPIDGQVTSDDYGRLAWLSESDGSTRHFDWSEFVEKKSSCSSSNTGTFNGGKVTSSTVRENVRRLMYRLEVLRHRRSGAHPIYIGSGFRSVPYNSCVKGASNSQHMYGTASDGKMKHLHQGHMRALAKTSQIHAMFCYGSAMHNHLDLRKDNPSTGGSFIWPSTNSSGQDLASKDGRVCYGGYSSPPSTGDHQPAEGVLANDLRIPKVDPLTLETEDPEAAAMRDAPEEVWMHEDD